MSDWSTYRLSYRGWIWSEIKILNWWMLVCLSMIVKACVQHSSFMLTNVFCDVSAVTIFAECYWMTSWWTVPCSWWHSHSNMLIVNETPSRLAQWKERVIWALFFRFRWNQRRVWSRTRHAFAKLSSLELVIEYFIYEGHTEWTTLLKWTKCLTWKRGNTLIDST